MVDLKITTNQLKNYLETGLKFYCQGEYDIDEEKPIEFELRGVNENGWVDGFGKIKTIEDQYHIDDVFPLMYRLSDLDKHIPELGFVPMEEITIYSKNKEYLIECVITGMVEKIVWDMLVKWHFWTFGEEHFDQGLVIDKMKQLSI